MKRPVIIVSLLLVVLLLVYALYRYINTSEYNPNPKYTIGQPLDSLNGVYAYYNGMVGHTGGRNKSADGYNLGMKYQCVEFVKRYYYQRLNHKMPDSYGNAKDFFDTKIADSAINPKRGLWQFTNGSRCKPQAEDLLIFDGHVGNPYGHVAIVSQVLDSIVEIIQQNPGPFASSRDTFRLVHNNSLWRIGSGRALGWLRKDTVGRGK